MKKASYRLRAASFRERRLRQIKNNNVSSELIHDNPVCTDNATSEQSGSAKSVFSLLYMRIVNLAYS